MVPLWLDEDTSDVDNWIVTKVRTVFADDNLPKSFVQALFRHKRLILIADSICEKSAETQAAIRHAPGYLNAFVITSRTEQKFRLPDVRVIEAVPLQYDTVLGFLMNLLQLGSNKCDAYRDIEMQLDLASRLVTIITVGQDKVPVTPLLVMTFVEQAVDQAAIPGAPDLDTLPKNVPEVYFEYLRRVNPSDSSAANYLPDDDMMHAAKVIARVEIGDDFQPKRVDKKDIQAALQQSGLNEQPDSVQRLLDNQVLESKVVGASTLVAFALDPIAEYLAAFAHAEDCGADETSWRTLWDAVAEHGDNAAGFNEALRITHEVFAHEMGWP